jgi:hypothetical protein
MVGRAIIRAARLEKCQEWFGVFIDPEILNEERLRILSVPLLKPLALARAMNNNIVPRARSGASARSEASTGPRGPRLESGSLEAMGVSAVVTGCLSSSVITSPRTPTRPSLPAVVL